MTPTEKSLLEQMQRLRSEIRARPIISSKGRPAPSSDRYEIVIAEGNASTIGHGLDGIVYRDVLGTLPSAYDPDTDTAYIDGLGRGVLLKNGVDQGYVLVRHNWLGYPVTVLSGMRVRSPGVTIPVVYTPGVGSPVTMQAYIFDGI
jgi:hypothetical protein